MLSYNQTLVRKAACLARLAGFATIVSDSASTESSYLYIGRLNGRGFDTVTELRVSCHRKPGYGRGGWLDFGPYRGYDLRPRSRRNDMERVRRLIVFALGR